jgi:hypothetical protein
MLSALRFLRAGPRARASPSRFFGVVSDYAAKTALNSMVDHISSPRGASSASAASESAELRPDIEYDALTWKSIVDRPVVDSADNISCDDLYPPSAPSLDKGVTDESADALDFRAFPGAMSVDPFLLVAPDLRGINVSIKALLGVDHPVRPRARARERVRRSRERRDATLRHRRARTPRRHRRRLSPAPSHLTAPRARRSSRRLPSIFSISTAARRSVPRSSSSWRTR